MCVCVCVCVLRRPQFEPEELHIRLGVDAPLDDGDAVAATTPSTDTTDTSSRASSDSDAAPSWPSPDSPEFVEAVYVSLVVRALSDAQPPL